MMEAANDTHSGTTKLALCEALGASISQPRPIIISAAKGRATQ